MGQQEYVSAPVELEGTNRWVTLTGSIPNEDRDHGEGTRGLIIRYFDANLNNRRVTEPWIAGFRTEGGMLNAEVLPPPGVKKLRKGDFVNMLLELMVFPRETDDYYGSDSTLIGQLKSNADTWKMTAWEATSNNPCVSVDDGRPTVAWPLTISAENRDSLNFEIAGGTGLIPLRITGLPSPSGWHVLEVVNGQEYPLGKRHSEEAKPQIEFDRLTSTWTTTLSLRPPRGASERTTRTFHWVRDL